jgi:putative sterol carrier protein
MVDTIEGFFQQLVDQQPQPLLAKVRGTVRFHLVDPQRGDDHWLIAIDHGDISVSHVDGRADGTMRSEKAFFERLLQGKENAIAAMLRGAIVCSAAGDSADLSGTTESTPSIGRRSAWGSQ